MEYIVKEMHGLGVNTKDQIHSFQLRDEGQVGEFLGLRIEKMGDGKFNLTQTGLIDEVLIAAKMEDIHYVPTPVSTVPLRIDKYGDKFDEDWEYATIVGMLMYSSKFKT